MITPEERDYQAALSAIHAQVKAIQALPFVDRLSLKAEVDKIIEGVYDDARARTLARQFGQTHALREAIE